jgi:hypothetical protein
MAEPDLELCAEWAAAKADLDAEALRELAETREQARRAARRPAELS